MNGLDEALLREFLDDYYAEADEHLATLRSDLLALEDGVDGLPVERQVLERLFRALHTLKGLSGMVELSDAERVSHALEGALRALRDGQCPPGSGPRRCPCARRQDAGTGDRRAPRGPGRP